MRRPDQRRLRRVVGWASALVAAVLLAAAVPATSSAFTASVTNSSNSAASKAVFTCADVFASDARQKSAFFEYTLLKPAGERLSATVAADSSPQGNTGAFDGSRGSDTASSRPCPADPGTPYALDGTTSRVLTSKRFEPIRGDLSIEIWFKTSTRNEKLIGFESQQAGTSSNYDKHLYVDTDGLLRFAIYNSDGNTTTATSVGRTVDDGNWHQAVATVSSTDGCVLYLDGVQVGANPKSIAENFAGYWRIGEGTADGWPNAPAHSFFTGSLAFAGAYGTVLSAAAVRSAYDIGKPATRTEPIATPSTTPSATPTASPSASATPEPTASAVPDATPSPSPSPSSSPSGSQEPATTASQHPESTPTYIAPSQDPDISTAQ